MTFSNIRYTLLLFCVLFSLSFFSCRYGVEKYDEKITGLWVHLDKEWELFDDNVHHLYFTEDGTFSSMSGAQKTDSITWGPFPYELQENVLTRHYPTGVRKDSIKIKWTPAGKFMTMELIGNDHKIRYKYLRKKFKP